MMERWDYKPCIIQIGVMENTGAWENSFSLRFIYEGITEGGNDLSTKSRDFP